MTLVDDATKQARQERDTARLERDLQNERDANAGLQQALAEAATKFDDRYFDLLRVYVDVREQRTNVDHLDEAEYWQGKKDGLRTALTLFAPDEEEKQRWEGIQESAPNNRLTEMENLRAALAEARELLYQFNDLPNDIRYQMGTTFGSTKLDEAYAQGWNDLRVKIGREMLERIDVLSTHPAPGDK